MILSKLATGQGASSSAYPHNRLATGSKHDVICNAYSLMCPYDAGIFTQLILKDMRPILYPIRAKGTFAALRNSNSKAVHMLTIAEAMRVWTSTNTLYRCYVLRSTIEDACELWGMSTRGYSVSPKLGVPIKVRQIPSRTLKIRTNTDFILVSHQL